MKKKKNLLAWKENLLAWLNFWWPRASGRPLMRRLQWYMLSILHSQYQACWCTGDFSSQCISRHGIHPQSRNIPSPVLEEFIFVLSPFLSSLAGSVAHVDLSRNALGSTGVELLLKCVKPSAMLTLDLTACVSSYAINHLAKHLLRYVQQVSIVGGCESGMIHGHFLLLWFGNIPACILFHNQTSNISNH